MTDTKAPWNEPRREELELSAVAEQTLHCECVLHTSDYEVTGPTEEAYFDEDGGMVVMTVPGVIDTTDTDWTREFLAEHYTPLDLIRELKEAKEEEKTALELQLPNITSVSDRQTVEAKIISCKFLIEECELWTGDTLKAKGK